MASDVTNGIGGIKSVTDTAVKYQVSPVITNGVNSEFSLTLKVWNTGGSTVYAIVNAEVADMDTTTAIPIPADSDFWFVGGRKPIKSVVLACATGETSTANIGAF